MMRTAVNGQGHEERHEKRVELLHQLTGRYYWRHRAESEELQKKFGGLPACSPIEFTLQLGARDGLLGHYET